MLLAKLALPPNAVAKYSCAPGAMSWMISSIAVPSSHEAVALHWPAAVPLCPGSTVTGPRSPDACAAARLRTPSDSTPILMPVPSDP